MNYENIYNITNFRLEYFDKMYKKRITSLEFEKKNKRKVSNFYWPMFRLTIWIDLASFGAFGSLL